MTGDRIETCPRKKHCKSKQQRAVKNAGSYYIMNLFSLPLVHLLQGVQYWSRRKCYLI